MTANELLNHVAMLDDLIKNTQAEYDDLLAIATKITPGANDGMPHANSGISDKVGKNGAKMADLLAELEGLVQHYTECKKTVTNALEQLPAIEYRVLYKYYIEHKGWARIATELHYSRMQVYRIKNKAIPKFIKILKEVTQCYNQP
jgi:hypothetical protein